MNGQGRIMVLVKGTVEEFARPVDEDCFNDSDADIDFEPKTTNMYISSTVLHHNHTLITK